MGISSTGEQVAARETLEEANARMLAPDCSAGDESQEVRLYSEADIPWEQLAFATIRHTLEFFFEDRESQRLHTGDIPRIADRARDPMRTGFLPPAKRPASRLGVEPVVTTCKATLA